MSCSNWWWPGLTFISNKLAMAKAYIIILLIGVELFSLQSEGSKMINPLIWKGEQTRWTQQHQLSKEINKGRKVTTPFPVIPPGLSNHARVLLLTLKRTGLGGIVT